MAEKTLKTRIQLRHDLYAQWTSNNPVLKKGELAIVEVPAESGTGLNEPSFLLKVGNGKDNFNTLPWVSGIAADVYEWAKSQTKPTYTAQEISGLEDFIAGEINDTNTRYQIVKDGAMGLKLQSSETGSAPWTDVSTITLTAPSYTLVTGETNGTVKFNGQEVAVAGLKSAAYAETTAFDTAGSANAVLGTSGDGSTANTVYGAKKGVEEAKQLANTKVASVTASDLSVEVGGEATNPTVKVKISADEGNALKLVGDGLKVEVGAAPEYAIKKEASADEGYFATYTLTKDGVQAGEKINIPKDYLVKKATIKESTGEGDPSALPAGTKYIDFVVNTKEGSGTESHIYLNVNELVDAYTAGNGVEISPENNISVKVVSANGLSLDGEGIKLGLVSGTSAGAMSSADKTKLDGIDEGANNYVHPGTHEATIITQDAIHRFVTDTQISQWNNKADKTEATTELAGLMSAADKTKLDGIANNAQANVLEGVQVNGVDLQISGKKVNIETASGTALGVVKTDETSIQSLDGTISVKSVNIQKLEQSEEDVLVLDCGTSL